MQALLYMTPVEHQLEIPPLVFVPRNLIRLSLVCVSSSECMCSDLVA